ncbi:MAG: sporulation protein [Gemmatimonadetes bacterium]|nr:sporulation protein [Gemmatimonadota bacterium]|tara:strand:+ start:1331 stop:1723 length:393 start_codon:yes stop_codon:yes gene_type:complete
MSVENMIKTILQEFKELAQTETVVGKPIAVGETVIVPVSKISFGFGAGGGGGAKAEGGGGTAGGGSVEPVGFIVISDGKAQLIPMQESDVSIGSLLKFAPDVIKKIKDYKEKRDKKGDGDGEAKGASIDA